MDILSKTEIGLLFRQIWSHVVILVQQLQNRVIYKTLKHLYIIWTSM